MRIGILTFSAAVNYGAVLQAYALKATLEQMGHEACVIDYKPGYITDFYYPFMNRPGYRSALSIRGLTRWTDFIFSWARRRWLRRIRFNIFKRKYLSLDTTPIDNLSNSYDLIICGSDQIWNREITDGFDPVFFGDFNKDKKARVIAYAGSVGSPKRVEGHEQEFIRLLSNFDAISVREHNLEEFIRATSNNSLECATVLDPTLIAPREAFMKLSEGRLVAEPYLLYFDLFNDDSIREKARKIAEEKRLRFIEVSTYHENTPSGELFSPVGPDGLLSLVRYADMVITNSFHCTVFSIIFERQFFTFEFEKKFNDRILNLLDMIGLSDRFVYREMSKLDWSPIKFDVIRPNLETARQSSLKWLEGNIE